MDFTLTTLLHHRLFIPVYEIVHRHTPNYGISSYTITDLQF